MKEHLIHTRNSILRSYSMVFFSDNHYFGLCLVAASFTDPLVGVSGLIGVVFSVAAAMLFGLSPANIRNGFYSYNALLSGLALGAFFNFNPVLILFASLLALLFSIWMSSWSARFRLPFLSLPFIVTAWILLLNSGVIHSGFFIPRSASGGSDGWSDFVKAVAHVVEVLPVHHLALLYFKSLSAVFFQNNFLAGMLIALGLLIHSRIAFSLSILGFTAGYLYFKLFEGNPASDDYYYTAFNYILTAIGIGGFFLLPSKTSYLFVVLATPVIGLVNGALQAFTGAPVYSLSFSLVTIIIVSALNSRYYFKYLEPVQYQLYSPEKNLYAYHNYMERFENNSLVHMHLPFFGEWTVSQGYDGDKTHKKDWRYAWDFVVTDEHKRTFRLPGKKTSDFYCYALPVLAPADGKVVVLEDGIDDNAIGDVNLTENWGNTIIIKHGEQLYSKLSHLKKNSFRVKQGDPVKRGDLLALCGNSGRSPEPHIHFQLQDTPTIGSKTIRYPVSYYITKKGDNYLLHTFDEPEQDETVLKPGALPLLKQCFHFIPGKKFKFEVNDGSKTYVENWEVMTDELNHSYLLCKRTQAIAYFTGNDTMFCFTGFTGTKNCLLYYFYLGAHKLLLSYFAGLVITDNLSVEETYKGPAKFIQDFAAPFGIYLKPVFKISYENANDKNAPTQLKISSAIFPTGNPGYKLGIDMELSGNSMIQMSILKNNKCITARNIQ